MTHDWFIRCDGKERGPFTAQQLKELARKGDLAPDDLVRRADMQTPRKASAIKGLFTPVEAATRSAPPPATATAPPPTAQRGGTTKKPLLIGAAVGGACLLLCCGGLGVIGVLAPKNPDPTQKQIAEADKDRAPTKHDSAPNQTAPDEQPGKKDSPADPAPLGSGIVEWKDDNGRVQLYSDKPIPILYGVPKIVIRQMPADQLAVITAVEKLGEEANTSAKEQADNPVFKPRLIKEIERKALEITYEFNGDTLAKSKMTAAHGWIGRITLGPQAKIKLGKVTTINPVDPYYDYDVMQGKKKPPRTVYRALEGSDFIVITIDTTLMTDAGVAQFKALKNGDWVKVDLPSSGFSALPLVRFGERQKMMYAVYDSLEISEGLERFNKPRTKEAVITKLEVTD